MIRLAGVHFHDHIFTTFFAFHLLKTELKSADKNSCEKSNQVIYIS